MNNKFYNEIEHIIKRNEINKKARKLEDNYDTLKNYFEIGRLIVEAQGGSSRAKYGNELIKKWSERLSKNYGKGYDESNLRKFRTFYNIFEKSAAVRPELNWTIIKTVLPIKNENKRNYYINLCIDHNLSSRELIKEIKNYSYERLINKPEKIEIKNNIQNNIEITSNIMNPLIIYVEDKDKERNHKDLELEILSQLQVVFRQLGNGYTLVGNEYKITYENNDYFRFFTV